MDMIGILGIMNERQFTHDGLHRQINIKNTMNVPERSEIE